MTTVILIVSLGLILIGAEVFTNSIEWLGKRLNLCEGAIGSVFAAVGTALPETMIPIIAIFFGKDAGHEIGIGAILGAPFMLGTLALFISGMAVLLFSRSRLAGTRIKVDYTVMTRDMKFFLVVYSLALGTAFLPYSIRHFIAIFLVLAYIIYVYKTVTEEKDLESEDCSLKPLYFARKAHHPRLLIILAQVAAALALIVGGAHLFVQAISEISLALGVPAFILALVIAPVATELPEKFNSVIWIRRGKDTLALGNITGAMVFQSSVIPAIGILLTEWSLSSGALLSGLLTLISAGLLFVQIRIRKHVSPYILLTGGLMYAVFIYLILKGFIR